MSEMDHVDSRQQAEISALQESAQDNKRTDRLQWVVLLLGIAGLLLYMNMALITLSRDQSETIRYLRDKCK